MSRAMPPLSIPPGPERRDEEGKRTDDHILKNDTYKILNIVDGKLVEKEVPMLNALNEVLRDDYIKRARVARSAGTA